MKVIFLLLISINVFAQDPYSLLGLKPNAPFHEVMKATADLLVKEDVFPQDMFDKGEKSKKIINPEDMNAIGKDALEKTIKNNKMDDFKFSEKAHLTDDVAEFSKQAIKSIPSSPIDPKIERGQEIIEAYSKIKYSFPDEVTTSMKAESFKSLYYDILITVKPNTIIDYKELEKLPSSTNEFLKSKYNFEKLSDIELKEITTLYDQGKFDKTSDLKILLNYLEKRVTKTQEAQSLMIKIFNKNIGNMHTTDGIYHVMNQTGNFTAKSIKEISPALDIMIWDGLAAKKMIEGARNDSAAYRELMDVYKKLIKYTKGDVRKQVRMIAVIEDIKKGLKAAEPNFLKKCFVEAMYRVRFPLGF